MRARRLMSRPLVIVAVVSALAGTYSWSQLGGASGSTTTPDRITYNQSGGSKGTYTLYIPGDGSASTKQSITGGGGCATPNPRGTPLLDFSALYYSSGYAGTSTPAIVGAYQARTGVCQIPQSWSIEKNEALIFSVGPNSLTTGRQFSRAQIQLEREDKSVASDPAAAVEAVLKVGATVVNTQNFSIAGPNGTQITLDTGEGFAFTSIELRVTSPATGSVSVVGPTSTFYLANEICGGETISDTSTGGTVSTGEVSASFFFDAASGVCKSYSFFAASSTDTDSSTLKSVKFFSQQLAGAHMLATFDWGYFPYCRPDGTAPTCPTPTVDFGSGPVAETFCPPGGATATIPWCVTSRYFDYVQDPADSSVTLVHITEKWDGLGDVLWRFH